MHRILAQISVGERFVVSRAVNPEGGAAAVVKSIRPDRHDARSAALLRHEWDVLRGFDSPRIACAVALESDEHGPVLVTKDAGALNLCGLLDGRPLDAGRFLELAVGMTAALGDVHRAGYTHRDISPANFVVDKTTTLVDFETATATSAFTRAESPPSELEGTLAYLAPEQTGRMNRSVDRRADLYALGATFYEMLTGAPPFQSRDPFELLHAHVARRPHAPAVVNASVPTALSNIVLKLLSKMPEWRYQTAEALLIDLEDARRQWQTHGRIEQFELARHDVPYGLLIADTLYGREHAQRQLEHAVQRVAGGRTEVVLVSGPPGIGKSVLVRQAKTAAASRRWIEGKGDQLASGIPYAAIMQGFRRAVAALALQPPEALEPLRDRLQAAVGPNGRVLVDLIPELSALIGDQPAVSEVGPMEAEHRVEHVFVSFIRALAVEMAPVVVFIDDLQWADDASLKLLTAIATEPDLRSLLVIGAYRPEEIGATHPLRRAITRIRTSTTTVTDIELGELEPASILALVGDALHVSSHEARSLADAIYAKTAGNPFFVRRFLGYLYQSRLLAYDATTGKWSWDMARIEQTAVTENVVDLLSASIGMLDEPTRELVETAAHIGSEFGLGLLAAVRGQSQRDVACALWAAVYEGLIVPVSGEARFPWAGGHPIELGSAYAPAYRFVHDRVQEAAYARVPVDRRTTLHLQIGRWLLAHAPPADFDAAIGAIVDQLNRAPDQLDSNERLQLAELDHRAGRIACGTAAYDSAFGYFWVGLTLLPERSWGGESHALWFGLTRNAAECAALIGQHERCDEIVAGALEHIDAPEEQAALYHVLAQAKALRGNHADTIRYERRGLQILGVDLPHELTPSVVDAERKRIRELVHAVQDPQLLDATPMTDANERMRLKMLVGLAAATWFTAPELFTFVSCRGIELTVRRGIAPESPFAFSTYAITLAMHGEYDEAYRFGTVAVTLAERSANPAQLCRALMVLGGHVSPWLAPVERSVPLLRRAFAEGRASGELEYAAYALANLVFVLWYRGAAPSTVLDEATTALAFYRRVGHVVGIAYITPFVQAARCLTGLTTERASFDDRAHDEARFLAEESNGLALAVYYVLRLQACYLLGEPARALDYAANGEPWLPYLRTIVLRAEHAFYAALAIAAVGGDLKQLRAHLDQLEHWSRQSPSTFEHKCALVTAELARLEQHPNAGALYERAVASAKQSGCVHEVALAHECYARFLGVQGDAAGSGEHLRAAVEHYVQWGASAKIAMLVAEHPELREIAHGPFGPPSVGTELRTLDLEIVLEAAETITSELAIDRLLPVLMRISVSAASAERAVLVLDSSEPTVRAVATAAGEVALVHTRLAHDSTVPTSVIEHVLQSGDVVVLEDASRDARFSSDPRISSRNVRSVLAVPLRKADDSVGALYFENNLATGAFTEERVQVFRVLAAQMAVALQNSLLFEEHRIVEQRMRVLATASSTLSESLDYAQVIARVGALVIPTLADWCTVDILEGRVLQPAGAFHVDPDQLARVEELRQKAPVDLDSPHPQAQVIRTREPLLMADVTDDALRASVRDEEHLGLLRALSPRSAIMLPLIAHGRSIGALTLVRSRSDHSYDAEDLALTEELSHRIAMAIDNARLYRDLDREIQLRAQRDRYLRMIFRQIPGAIYATDRDLRITYSAGYLPNAPLLDHENTVGKTIYDFVETTDPTHVTIAHHLAALDGHAQTFEVQQYGRWYGVRLEPLRKDGEILGCVAAAIDVTERRETQDKLARNEARLAEAQRVAHVGSFEWDIAQDTVTWTDELHRIYGLEPGQFGGSLASFLAQVYPDDLELTKHAVVGALADPKEFIYDHRIVRRDGALRMLHTRADVIVDGDGRPVRLVGTCWDVTELTEASAARERSLSLLQATVEATADGLLVVDLAGTIVLCNERLRTLWNLTDMDLTNEDTCIRAMAAQVDDSDVFRMRMLERQTRRDHQQQTDVVRLSDGRVFERYVGPQRIGDTVVGVVWSYRDISEREQLLRRALFLADATRLLGSLDVERALDAVAHLAVPYLGEACAVDLLGNGGPRRLLAVTHDTTKPIATEVHPAVLAGSATIYRVGSTSYLGVPMLAKSGSVGAITLAAPPERKYTDSDLDLAEDLGQRAALSIENARLYKRAQQAVQGRDEFLSIASHEIRGPITSLHLAVEMLGKGLVAPAAQSKALEIIERADHRLGQFVDELLDLSRIRSGTLRFEFEEVDLVTIVRHVANQLSAELARSGSTLSVTVEGPVQGEWDRFRLDQIVTNLLSNALKFGLGKPIEIIVSHRGNRAVLVVRDHGLGIAPELQARIFEPFERGVSVRHYGGLGLGLYIVHTIVQAFGGSVHVDSVPGAGATFTVELPTKRTE